MDIFQFLLQKIESLLGISREKKIFFVSIFVFFYTLFSAYYGVLSSDNLVLLDFLYIFLKFILINLLFFLIVWIVGKILGGKANFLHVSFVLSLAQLPFLIFYVLGIIFIVLGYSFEKVITLFAFICIVLTLYILSKLLAKIEGISESKVTIIIVLSSVIYYLLGEIVGLII